MKSRKADAMLLAQGPIELVGRRAQATLAKGYSLLELKRAGLTIEEGRALGIPIDTERTSGVGANVMLLRQRLAAR
jgi:ribosomal protein L13E